MSGAVQGGGAELAFALGGYRVWTLPIAALAGALAGLAAAIHDIALYYPATGLEYWAIYTIATMSSGAVIAGIGSWLLLRALLAAGVLGPFAVGREQREI